jgi:prepilin-type N-terminal cleavage/methylation domain-containing protein
MNLKNKGFTLAEIMVSIAIVVMIMSVVLFGYRSYDDSIILSSAAQEMAISIRQAQSYGVSVKQVVGGDFNTSYGISFNLSNPGSYYIFADKNNNGKYDGDVNCSSGTECVEKDDLKNAVGLSSFCSTDLGGTETCPAQGVQSVSILFKRPDTDAYIYTFNSSGTMISGSYVSVKIVFSTRSGQQSNVSVNSIGQVTVK